MLSPQEKQTSTIADGLLTFTSAVILGLILFSAHPYVQLTYDSYDYIAASANIHTYLTGKNSDGFFYLVRPPLLPLYLHFFQDPLLAGALLNCFSFTITIFMCLRIGRLIGLDSPAVYIVPLSVIFSYSFLQCHLFLWTEPAFSAIILIIFYCIVTDKPIHWVILFLILAFLLRKAAGFTTLAIVAVYLCQGKIRQAVIASAAMAIIFIAWEAFTIYHTGFSLSGETWTDHATLTRMPYVDSVTSWILPRALPSAIRALLLAGIIVLIAGMARRAQFTSYWKDARNQHLFIFWFVYGAGLFVFWGTVDFHEADRFLAVILPLFMLTVFSLLFHVFNSASDRRRIQLLSVIWLLYPVSKTLYIFVLQAHLILP